MTDDFIAYTATMGEAMDLEQTTEFLVVAATLLDLKAARLLPSGEVDDLEDLALLRRATCCSRGCCSTGPTSRRRRCSPNSRRRPCSAIRARSASKTTSRNCYPR